MKDSRGNADPRLWEQGGVGPDPGEQLLLELSGTEQGLPGLGSHCLHRQPITSPLSRGKEASVFIWCRKKLLFHCQQSPRHRLPLTPGLCWKDKHSSFPEHNKVPP